LLVPLNPTARELLRESAVLREPEPNVIGWLEDVEALPPPSITEEAATNIVDESLETLHLDPALEATVGLHRLTSPVLVRERISSERRLVTRCGRSGSWGATTFTSKSQLHASWLQHSPSSAVELVMLVSTFKLGKWQYDTAASCLASASPASKTPASSAATP
jgi:hypothetical protein